MKLPADDAEADADQTQPASRGANSDHQTLASALVACALELRTLHEHYLALSPQETSGERREHFLQLLHAEQAVMKETLRLLVQLDALLRVDRALLLRAHIPPGAGCA